MKLTLTVTLRLGYLTKTAQIFLTRSDIDIEFDKNGTNLSYKKCPNSQNPTPCLPSWLRRKTVSNMIKQHKMFGFTKSQNTSMFKVLRALSGIQTTISGVIPLFANNNKCFIDKHI